jgi:hypothetical protein
MSSAWQKIQDSALMGTPASDMSLIYGFMKINDPGSSVKEGEYATAQNAAGVPEQIRTMYNAAKDGQKLGANQRLDFYNQSKSLFNSHMKKQEAVDATYKALAAQRNLRPEDVIVNFGEASSDGPKQDPQIAAFARDHGMSYEQGAQLIETRKAQRATASGKAKNVGSSKAR